MAEQSGSGSVQQRAGEAAGWDPERPRLQNLRAHLQAIPRSPSLLGCSGEGQSWALLIQPPAWLLPPGSPAGIPLRKLAASMGHDVRTHIKHYGQWTDEAGLDAAFGAANTKLTAFTRPPGGSKKQS